MMKVIVADDEYFARKALVMMMEKMELPIEICGECEDGEEVVDLLKTYSADLIITDIRMPGLDGLKLAEYVKEHELDTDMIIETGYADFNYARTALRYGVKDYLMKPLNEGEVRDSICKVIQERQKKCRDDSLRLLDFGYVLENTRLRDQVLGWGQEQEQGSYCMVLVNGRERIKDESMLRKWLGRYGNFEKIYSFFFEMKNEWIMLAFGQKQIDLEKCFGKIATLELKKSYTQKMWISFSDWHQGAKELEHAYRECIYAMNERILKKKQIFCYRHQEFRDIITLEQEQQLQDAVERGSEQDARKVIQEVISEAQKDGGNIYSFYTALMRVFFVLNRFFYKKNESREKKSSSGEYLLFDFKMDLYQFYDLEGVEKYVDMLLKEACQKNTEKENDSMIENLIDYLERHYSEDISLGELAERKYFVSISYLSRLFKEYTGQNFMKYLIRLRMEKARKFLECSQMEISDIAACTGYNDPSHFTQTFRKVYGISPKEYRKKNHSQ